MGDGRKRREDSWPTSNQAPSKTGTYLPPPTACPINTHIQLGSTDSHAHAHKDTRKHRVRHGPIELAFLSATGSKCNCRLFCIQSMRASTHQHTDAHTCMCLNIYRYIPHIESLTEATEVQKCPRSLKALDTFPRPTSSGTCPRLARSGPVLSNSWFSHCCVLLAAGLYCHLSLALSLPLLCALHSSSSPSCYLHLSGSCCRISWNVTALATMDLIYLVEWRVLLLWYSMRHWGPNKKMLMYGL